MSAEENKEVIRKFFEELGKGNLDIVDEVYSPNLVRHWHEGTKNFKDIKQQVTKHKGKITISIDEMIAEGDRIASWHTYTRKEDGEKFNMCFIYRFSGGKIAEEWNMLSLQSNEKGYL